MDPLYKEPTPLAHRLYMSKHKLSLLISILIVALVLGGIFWIYWMNKKPKQTQLEKNVENVAQRAASITTTPEQKQKMVESLNSEESFKSLPKESKNADEDLVNQFLQN